MRLQLHRKEGFLLASEWRRRRRRRWLSRRLTPLPPTIKQQQWLIKSREEEKRVPGAFFLPPSSASSLESRGGRELSPSQESFLFLPFSPLLLLSLSFGRRRRHGRSSPKGGEK